MPPAPSNSPAESFERVTHETRAALTAARETKESIRATRRRVRLHGLISSWRGRRATEPAVQSERLAMVLDVVRDEADAPMGNIQVFKKGVLRIESAAGLSRAFLDHFAQVETGKCCCGLAFQRGAPVVIDDIRQSPVFSAADRDTLLNTGIQACQSLALNHHGQKLGVISLHYREPAVSRVRQAAFAGLASEIAEAVSLALV